MTEDETAVVKLARVTRVDAHKRRKKDGGSEQVDSYLRKVLDAAGLGFGDKTKKGAVAGQDFDIDPARPSAFNKANMNTPSTKKADEEFAKSVENGLKNPGETIRGERETDLRRKLALKKAEVAQGESTILKRQRIAEENQKARDAAKVQNRTPEQNQSGRLDPEAQVEVPQSSSPKGTLAFSEDEMFVKGENDIWESQETYKKVSTADLPNGSEVYFRPGASGRLGKQNNADKAERLQMKNFHSKKFKKPTGHLGLSANDSALVKLAGRLDQSPKKNWVENSGGLPAYIEDVAIGIMKSGKSREQAIPMAISRIKRWAAGGDGVNPDTVAKSQAAIAQWEKLKATNAAKK